MTRVEKIIQIVLVLSLTQACTTLPAPSSGVVDSKPANEGATPSAGAKPVDSVGPGKNVDLTGCPAKGSFQAADLSEPVSQQLLDTLKKLNVYTVIRYGDYVGNETIRGKIPKPTELKLIKDNGFSFMAVFQHNNSKFASFTSARGQADAEEMQKLFPFLPVHFYGVDFDASSSQLPNIEAYAKAFKAVADKHGKKTGAYGSGRALTDLFSKGLIQYKWISQSTGFDGTAALTQSKGYQLLQKLPLKRCGGKEFDPNVANGDFGAVAL